MKTNKFRTILGLAALIVTVAAIFMEEYRELSGLTILVVIGLILTYGVYTLLVESFKQYDR